MLSRGRLVPPSTKPPLLNKKEEFSGGGPLNLNSLLVVEICL